MKIPRRRRSNSIKGTLARSGMRRQVPARRRFGNIHTRLRIRVRNINQDPYFVVLEWSTQIYENTELFSPFLLFLGPNNSLPIMKTWSCAQQYLRRRLPKRFIVRLENSTPLVKAISSSMMCYAPFREIIHFGAFSAFCATRSQLRVHENTS